MWREFGGNDPSASLRQKDQFIFLEDLKDLCEKVKPIFGIAEISDETIAKMDVPVMEFSYGEKERDFIIHFFNSAEKKSTKRRFLEKTL